MRLWHKDLIDVLPNKQLLGQLRELSAIAGAIIKCSTPNHLLVNKVLDFTHAELCEYTRIVYRELKNRNFNVKDITLNKIYNLNSLDFAPDLSVGTLYKDWHNDRYLKQCLYNLQEKMDCGGISKKEWLKIKEKFNKFL